MGNPDETKEESKTGEKTKVERKPIIVNPWVKYVENPNVQGDVSYQNYENKYEGKFSHKEKKMCTWIIGHETKVKDNTRNTIYVNKGEEKDKFIYNVTRDKNVKVVRIKKLSKGGTIEETSGRGKSKVNNRDIEMKNWNEDEKRIVLSSISALKSEELDLIENLKITRVNGRPPSGSEASDDGGPGAHYVQEDHEIEVFDRGLRNGFLMALGSPPDLPAGAHNILHEVGHVLALAEEREAKRTFYEALRKMINKWSTSSQSCLDKLPSSGGNGSSSESEDSLELSSDISADGVLDEVGDSGPNYFECSYNNGFNSEWDNPRGVNEGGKYENDLDEFKDVKKEYEKFIDGGEGRVMSKFEDEIVNAQDIPPVTPYSKEGGEEFFAEAFALYKWDPEWLEENRENVWKFFDNENHIFTTY